MRISSCLALSVLWSWARDVCNSFRWHAQRQNAANGLAKCSDSHHVIGFVGMVWMFQIWNAVKQVEHFSSVADLMGVELFV